LLVTDHVPPRPGIATIRSRQLIQRLPEFGWDVDVFTQRHAEWEPSVPVYSSAGADYTALVKRSLRLGSAQAEDGGIISASQRRRGMKAWAFQTGYAVTEYATRRFGWIRDGVPALRDLLASGRYDAVLSTSPPESAHAIVALANGARVPWVADFRDLWRRDHLWRTSPVRVAADSILESAALRGASAITTVSQPYVRLLQRRYPGRHVAAIPNAFDAAEWSEVPFERSDLFRIVYAGQFYDGRSPELLLRTLESLIARRLLPRSRVRFDVYGCTERWLRDLIARYNLEGVVHIHALIPRSEVMRRLRRANLLLLALWNHPSEEGMYTGKVFEYLGARRPIIAVDGPQVSVIDDLLERTGAGKRHHDEETLARAVLEGFEAHERGEIVTIPLEQTLAFESAALARGFCSVLEAIRAHA